MESFEMIYVYRTKVCDWVIVPHEGGCQLRWYFPEGFEISGFYRNPGMAADDVAHGATGFDQWDRIPHSSDMADLGNWEKMSKYVQV